MNKYLLKVTNVYRVPNEKAALSLREELEATEGAELTAFSYTQKAIREKGQVVETYLVCKATLEFNKEKELNVNVDISYDIEFLGG